MPRVSVIIVNYNSGDRLARCLDCLASQRFADFETIVIDNASTDGSKAAAEGRGVVRLIEAGANLGFAAANNRAAREAAGEWLAFLNPDAYAETGWLEALMDAAARFPDIDAFGSTQLDAADPERIDGAGDVMHVLGLAYRGAYGRPVGDLPPEAECFAPCAAAALYRRDAFERLGGFDERFFCYGEDVDLGFRLRLAGGRAMQIPAAVVLHEGSGVTGRESDFTVFHGNRNRVWLTFKTMPGALYWPLFPARLVADLYLLARWAMIGKGRAYARALREGYFGLWRLRLARAKVQRSRRASLRDIAAALAWSPAMLATRAPKAIPPAKSRREKDA